MSETNTPAPPATRTVDGATVRRTVLPGGVRVLTESMPGLRSATIGAWVGVGSRDEADAGEIRMAALAEGIMCLTAIDTALAAAAALDPEVVARAGEVRSLGEWLAQETRALA